MSEPTEREKKDRADCIAWYGEKNGNEIADHWENLIKRIKENPTIIKPRLGKKGEEMENESKWQPIETAPKDGTRILLYGSYQWEDYEDRKESGIIVGYFRLCDWNDDDNGSWVAVNANPYTDYVQPTHWMPLPNHPKGE